MSRERIPPSIDLHEDVSTYFLTHGGGEPLGDFNKDLPGRDADIPKYQRGNVRIVFAAIFPGIESFDPGTSRVLEEAYGKWLPATRYRVPQALFWEHISIYYKLSEAYGVRIIESFNDVEECLRGQVLCFIIHLEGAEAIDDPYDLVILKKIGLRSLGLTWNYMNKYGTGCLAKKDLGLTSDGEELIRLANKLGVIIDLAHASKRTTLEAIEISKKPVIISHANARRLVDKPRNIDDEVLEALHRNRGVVGISAIGSLVSTKPRSSIDDLVQHFVYIYERFGSDILAIGTDFLGLLGLPAPEGFESIDKLPALYEKLREKGFSDRDIERIAYKNALRVIESNLR